MQVNGRRYYGIGRLAFVDRTNPAIYLVSTCNNRDGRNISLFEVYLGHQALQNWMTPPSG
jgi:hypothetical protein